MRLRDFSFKLFFKSYLSKLFGVYFIRWQISTIVLMPFMVFFEAFNFGVVPNLIISQCIGALIFFKIDKYIFAFFDKRKHKN